MPLIKREKIPVPKMPQCFVKSSSSCGASVGNYNRARKERSALLAGPRLRRVPFPQECLHVRPRQSHLQGLWKLCVYVPRHGPHCLPAQGITKLSNCPALPAPPFVSFFLCSLVLLPMFPPMEGDDRLEGIFVEQTLTMDQHHRRLPVMRFEYITSFITTIL